MQKQKRLIGVYHDYFENQKVVITGGGGYLGSYLAASLSNFDCKLYLIDLAFNDKAKDLANRKSNINLITLNLLNKEEVYSCFSQVRPDLIYHFAASLDRNRDFTIYTDVYKVNVEILHHLLQAVKSVPYKGFYLSSTSELYGNKSPTPFYETHEIMPVSPYSLTKYMAEKLLSSFSELNKKPYTIFRIFNFFGPNQPSSTFVGEMINTLQKGEIFKMSEGRQERDFLYIDELINQIKYLSTVQKDYNIYNLCSGKGTSLIYIVDQLKCISGDFKIEKSIPYRDNEIMRIIGSTDRLIESGYFIQDLNWNSALQNCISKTNFTFNK